LRIAVRNFTQAAAFLGSTEGIMVDIVGAQPLASMLADWRRSLSVVPSTFRLREERAADVDAREALLDAAFGPARFEKTCERLREGRMPALGLSFVATKGAALVGTLRLWRVEAGDREALMLGPLAVAAECRSAGIGRALIEHGLQRAQKLGHESVILVGDAPYYGRFGFSRAHTLGLTLPGPVDENRFLGLELVPGALAGAKGRVVGTGLLVGTRPQAGDRLAA
jgi:predicted N-acetyltransferase YhbS